MTELGKKGLTWDQFVKQTGYKDLFPGQTDADRIFIASRIAQLIGVHNPAIHVEVNQDRQPEDPNKQVTQ